ncbi:MAG: AhpC/TSA family protein [Bacteroides sp.]|nr:AhpC/TSA family protein [Bacteroides sp.]
MTTNPIKLLLATAATALLVSCGHGDSWTVDGTIEGADNQPLILEASTNGRWYALDTVVLKGSGNFKFTQKAAGYPDIYRLRLADRTLYFPIDSIETVTVRTNAEAFDSDYTLAGTSAAESLMAIDRKLLDAANRLGSAAVSDSLLKRDLANELLVDPSGIVSYYIINKHIGGQPLFNPNNRYDLRMIGAVANAFNERRPADPRTAYLRNLYTSSRDRLSPRHKTASGDTIVANSIGVLDISLYDERGKLHSLSELSEKGHPVILNFTMYSAEVSPAINLELNKAYEKYHSQGLEIFQVSIDEDEYFWQQSARNLPWITVYNSTADGSDNLIRYNVTTLPVSFILGRDGEIKERVDDITQLNSKIARYM